MKLSMHHLGFISTHTRLQPERPTHAIQAAGRSRKSRNQGALETKGSAELKAAMSQLGYLQPKT